MIQPISELGLTSAEIEILEECVQAHCHGFYTCAEIGVQPDMNAFIVGVFESVEEYEDHPTFFATRRYIVAQWPVLVMRANPDDWPAHNELPDDGASLAASIDPELAASDPDAAAHAGRYLQRSMARGVSTIWSSGGREFYRNRRGLCEDAPCCGCCNA